MFNIQRTHVPLLHSQARPGVFSLELLCHGAYARRDYFATVQRRTASTWPPVVAALVHQPIELAGSQGVADLQRAGACDEGTYLSCPTLIFKSC